MDSYLNDLRKQYREYVERDKQRKDELISISAELSNIQNRYYSLQFENEDLLKLQDLQLRLNRSLVERFLDKFNELNKLFDIVDVDVNGVLSNFAAQKAAEREMVLRTFQTFKEIPKAYSDEVVTEQMKEVEEEIAEISAVIEKESASFAALKSNYNAEETQGRDANFATFMMELKMIIIKLNLQIPRN